MIRFIYKRPLLRDWKMWVFYLMYRNQHRVKENEETEQYIPNKKIR